ncbi:LamB/YcsF family protein [Rhodococcoides yunnanense]|uniref:LamB/YcsF family protein n=1 Tax=Rhodococcoides yunnanense TaxID=278209 RepID=UPI000933A850|nr:5-oxoprolinase subunit PxpA [Rhodococcus yunnanensis]
MSQNSVALVADIGESFGNYTLGDDNAILDLITAANVACGFHAGDPRVMERTVRACIERGVEIGAHPGYPDLVGFGRRAMACTEDEIRTDTLYQIGALSAFVTAQGGTLSHVNPHGRMGNLTVTDAAHARGVAEAVATFDPSLVVVTQEGLLAEEARARGLEVALVFLADRGMEDDGTPVLRTEPGALIHDVDVIAARTIRMAVDGVVTSVHGKDVPQVCDLVLLHGDNAGAIENARTINKALRESGTEIAPLRSILSARNAVSA